MADGKDLNGFTGPKVNDASVWNGVQYAADPAAADPLAADPLADPMADAGAEPEGSSESLANLFGDEDAEVGDNETGDSAINLLMDKIDMALEQINELSQSIASLTGEGAGADLNRDDDVDLPDAPEGAEPTEEAPQMETEPMTDVSKSVQETLDKQDMLLSLVKSLTNMVIEQSRILNEQRVANKSLSDQLYNISEEIEVFNPVS